MGTATLENRQLSTLYVDLHKVHSGHFAGRYQAVDRPRMDLDRRQGLEALSLGELVDEVPVGGKNGRRSRRTVEKEGESPLVAPQGYREHRPAYCRQRLHQPFRLDGICLYQNDFHRLWTQPMPRPLRPPSRTHVQQSERSWQRTGRKRWKRIPEQTLHANLHSGNTNFRNIGLGHDLVDPKRGTLS